MCVSKFYSKNKPTGIHTSHVKLTFFKGRFGKGHI